MTITPTDSETAKFWENFTGASSAVNIATSGITSTLAYQMEGGGSFDRLPVCRIFFVFGGIEFNPVTLTILTVMKIQASLSCDKLLHNF